MTLISKKLRHLRCKSNWVQRSILACLVGLVLVIPARADCPSGPVVQPDTFETIGLEPILLDPAANDSHPCGIPLRVTSVTSADCDGVLFSAYNNNQIFYDPNSHGTCTIDYTVEDQEMKSASSTLTLHVLTSDPLATTDPADAQATVGDSVDLAVTASGGTGSYTFTWESSDTQAGTYVAVSGPEFTVTNVGGQSTLTIDPVALVHEGWYRAVVDDGSDNVTSAAAQLTVVEDCVPPTTPTRELETEQGVSLTINVITEIVNNPDLEFVDFVPPNPKFGNLEPDNTFSWLWHYNPDPAAVDVTDEFGYRVARADDPSCTADGLVRVSIVPASCEPPEAPVVHLETRQDTSRTINVITEILGSDPDLEFVDFVLPDPVHGDLVPDNTLPWLWHYHPNPGVVDVTDTFGYQIALSADPSCTAEGLVTMSILPPLPVAAFTHSCSGLTCTMDASSSTGEGLSYSWNFGDGSGDSGEMVTYSYSAAGAYSVTLTVTDASEQSASVTRAVTPVVAFNDGYIVTYGSVLSLPVTGLLGNDQGSSPLSFGGIEPPSPIFGLVTWNQAAGEVVYAPQQCATIIADTFGYRVVGTDGVSSDVGLVFVNIVPGNPPIADFAVSCNGLTCQFTDQSTSSSSHTVLGWDFGDGVGTSTQPNPAYTYAADGTYDVTLTVIDSCAQQASSTQTVQVSTLQVAAASPAEAVGAAGVVTRFHASVAGGLPPFEYRWQFKPFAWSDYQSLDNGPNYRGVYSENLTVNSPGAAQEGWYRLQVVDASVPALTRYSAPAALYQSAGILPLIGEAGQVSVGSDPVTVALGRRFTQPVVFAQPPSRDDGETAVVRLTNVQANRFTLHVDEAPYLDGVHGMEQVSYLVLEAGSWNLPDGRRLDVGLLSTSATTGVTGESWNTVDFPSPHTTTPVVLSQVQSALDPAWVKTRQRNATLNGFEVALEREDAAAVPHGEETVGWLAMGAGKGTWTEHPYVAGDTARVVSHVWRQIDIGEDLGALPLFVAALKTYYGTDGSALRHRNLDGTSVEVMVEEDTSVDSEVGHTTEVVSYVSLGRSGVLRGSVYDPGSSSE